MCMCACMHICMYGCMEKSQINRVLNEICTQLGMLRCKNFVVVLLGEPNTQNLCFLNMNFTKHQQNTRHTHVCIFYCIYTYLWKKLKPSINVHVCMQHICMYGCMDVCIDDHFTTISSIYIQWHRLTLRTFFGKIGQALSVNKKLDKIGKT